jgi:hypothetical protein
MARDRTAWQEALGDAWRALWTSRVVVWAAGLLAVAAFGLHDANADAFDPSGATRPFGAIGDALLAPAARWDSVWFLAIADGGYDGQRAAFFPLYPVLLKATGGVVGGVVVSLACAVIGLALLRRLVALDFGDDVARLCVALVAWFPAATFLSAVYSESLFLAVSVGAVYAARTGRWELAGAAGALATATRSAGLVLLVPLAVLWWRGADRRVRDVLWLALVPAGLAVFCGVLALSGEDALAPFRAQEAWMRAFAGPFGGVLDGAAAAWDGARDIVRGVGPVAAPYDPRWLDVALFGALVAGLVALFGALRRLPLAYSLYALASLALPLSYPVDGQPLMSLPRFLVVIWPLHLWLALVLVERPAARRATLAAFGVGLALVSAEFATWGWVA